jgi:hypothetical protein
VCLAAGPLFVAGLNVAAVACSGAALPGVLFAVRGRPVRRFGRLVLLVCAPFLLVGAAVGHGESTGVERRPQPGPFTALAPVIDRSVPQTPASLLGTKLRGG